MISMSLRGVTFRDEATSRQARLRCQQRDCFGSLAMTGRPVACAVSSTGMTSHLCKLFAGHHTGRSAKSGGLLDCVR